MEKDDIEIDDSGLHKKCIDRDKQITIKESTLKRMNSFMRTDDDYNSFIHRLLDEWEKGYKWITPQETIDFSDNTNSKSIEQTSKT